MDSSLPIGGENTHCVMTGHRGLASARLFTRLDELKEGDEFFLEVLGEKLAYKVEEINVILPEEVESLEIRPGEDLVSLVTCTPYGINTHRKTTVHQMPYTFLKYCLAGSMINRKPEIY